MYIEFFVGRTDIRILRYIISFSLCNGVTLMTLRRDWYWLWYYHRQIPTHQLRISNSESKQPYWLYRKYRSLPQKVHTHTHKHTKRKYRPHFKPLCSPFWQFRAVEV